MSRTADDFSFIPGRLLIDTCILNLLQDEGEFIFNEGPSEGYDDSQVPPDLEALYWIVKVNQRASFQFLVSPITFAELANEQQAGPSYSRVMWAMEMLDHWLTMLEDTADRVRDGGTVRHRFKLTDELQAFEQRLMQIPSFRRDPLDRLLMLQYKMGNCDAFLTLDRNTIWRYRQQLQQEGILILTPAEFWERLKPYAAIWY